MIIKTVILVVVLYIGGERVSMTEPWQSGISTSTNMQVCLMAAEKIRRVYHNWEQVIVSSAGCFIDPNPNPHDIRINEETERPTVKL